MEAGGGECDAPCHRGRVCCCLVGAQRLALVCKAKRSRSAGGISNSWRDLLCRVLLVSGPSGSAEYNRSTRRLGQWGDARGCDGRVRQELAAGVRLAHQASATEL